MKGIHVEGLFGRFDYDIQLAEGSTTILTGPNGFGKSTITGKAILRKRNCTTG